MQLLVVFLLVADVGRTLRSFHTRRRRIRNKKRRRRRRRRRRNHQSKKIVFCSCTKKKCCLHAYPSTLSLCSLFSNLGYGAIKVYDLPPAISNRYHLLALVNLYLMKYQMSHTPVKYLLIISFCKHHILCVTTILLHTIPS